MLKINTFLNVYVIPIKDYICTIYSSVKQRHTYVLAELSTVNAIAYKQQKFYFI